MRLRRRTVAKEAGALLDALAHGSGAERISAAHSLGRIVDPRIEGALMRALRDGSWFVRQAAIDSLIALDPDRPADPIITALKGDGGLDGAVGVAELTAEDLLQSGLWRLRSAQPVEKLSEALASKDSERDVYAKVLGDLGDTKAIPALSAALRDASPLVRASAANALGKLGAQEAAANLSPALDDPEGRVRQAAVNALRLLGQPGKEALEDARKSPSRRVRWAARRGLWRLRP